MADAVWGATTGSAATGKVAVRHPAFVRVTHWITTLCFLALLVSGVEILISHPRFYWGETGNAKMAPLFQLPIPASRGTVHTGYKYVLPDQNGWSRYLHFQSAWVVVLSGLLYGLVGIAGGHFRKNVLPASGQLPGGAWSYNRLQRLTYSFIVFVLFPFTIWTGLAMSPSIAAAFPACVTILGGQQSARTLHFFATILLSLFVVVHVAMVIRAGFRSRMRAMITGNPGPDAEKI